MANSMKLYAITLEPITNKSKINYEYIDCQENLLKNIVTFCSVRTKDFLNKKTLYVYEFEVNDRYVADVFSRTHHTGGMSCFIEEFEFNLYLKIDFESFQ